MVNGRKSKLTAKTTFLLGDVQIMTLEKWRFGTQKAFRKKSFLEDKISRVAKLSQITKIAHKLQIDLSGTINSQKYILH